LLISLLLSFSLLFAQTDGEGETLFQFSLYQGDRYVPLEGETFPLERLPFQIEMHLPEGQYVYVNFSRSDELYRVVRENRDFEEVLGFGGTGMAERYGNPDRKIILNDEGWHVWRVNGSEDNRFNSTFRKKGTPWRSDVWNISGRWDQTALCPWNSGIWTISTAWSVASPPWKIGSTGPTPSRLSASTSPENTSAPILHSHFAIDPFLHFPYNKWQL